MPQPSSATRGKIAEGLRILMRAGGLDTAGADFMRIYAGGPHPASMPEKDVAALHKLGWHWEPLRNAWVISTGGKPGGEMPAAVPENTCLG